MNLPKRKSIRLKDYDYSSNGAYFITVCTKDREPLLGCVTAETVGADIIRPISTEFKTRLTTTGQTVKKAIESIPDHYPTVIVEKYVIMPDHIKQDFNRKNNRADEAMGIKTGRKLTLAKIFL